MAKTTPVVPVESQDNITLFETRKVKALEKIAMNLEAITLFLEGLEADEWNNRLQWYLAMFKEAYLDPKLEKK